MWVRLWMGDVEAGVDAGADGRWMGGVDGSADAGVGEDAGACTRTCA